MNILLTGATGFIGQHMINSGNIYRCVIRDGQFIDFKDKFVIDSLSELTNWENCFTGIDSVVHLAGLAHNKKSNGQHYMLVNTSATLHFASEAAKSGVNRFVFVSSIGVHGKTTRNHSKFSHEDKLNCHNLYAQSKANAEHGLKKISEQTGMEIVIVRPTLVYGEKAPGNFGLFLKLIKKTPILPFGLVSNKRDFVSVRNLVSLLIECANNPGAAGHTFLASDMETVSIKSFTNAIAKGLDKRIIQLPIPPFIMRAGLKLIGKSSMAEQMLDNLEVDSSNIYEALNWKPPYSMEDSMSFLKDIKNGKDY